MGGAVGLGNRSPVAGPCISLSVSRFTADDTRVQHPVRPLSAQTSVIRQFLVIDNLPSAHAAQIVLDAPVKKTMIPLNITHQAIVTRRIHARLLGEDAILSEEKTLPRASSKLRHTLSSIIAHFTESYKAVFGFNDGPPLHDALTLGYVSRPSLFSCERHRVDVELTGQHSLGETVVDVWHYRSCDNSWGAAGRNCLVTTTINVICVFARSLPLTTCKFRWRAFLICF